MVDNEGGEGGMVDHEGEDNMVDHEGREKVTGDMVDHEGGVRRRVTW